MTTNTPTRLERDLTSWLSETAMPRTPDYADDILDQTESIRQRPSWTFVRRWIPIPERAPIRPRSALAVALLVALSLLLAAVATFVASRRTPPPPPFGVTGAGLLANTQAGDIVLVDPVTLSARTIVGGEHDDLQPRWSPDGTRLAFLRLVGTGLAVVIVDQSGRTMAVADPVFDIDTDSVQWSPDGRHIAFAAAGSLAPAIHLVDTATGGARRLAVNFAGGEIFWRPPDGRQLAFPLATGTGLGLVSVADGSVSQIPNGGHDPASLRLLGWTPDGNRVLFQDETHDPLRTAVVDVATGALILLDVAYGHISNDGSRVAGLRTPVGETGRLCVIAITGGTCTALAETIGLQGTHGAALSWSPDDRWIGVLGERLWLVDPLGVVPPVAVPADGPASWQRVSP